MNPASVQVLLIESDAVEAARIKFQLEQFSPGEYAVTVAERLSRALELLRQHAFSAALLDLSLPDGEGPEMIGRFKAAAPQLPFIALGAVNDDALALRAVHLGAQDYLIKKLTDGHILVRVIRYAVERQRADEELRRAHDLLEQRVTERTAFLKLTNRRLHEEISEREHTERILRRERDFSAALFDTVGAIVVVLDRHGCIVRCNRHCERVTGYTEDEIRGRAVWDVYLDPAEVKQVKPIFAELLARKSENKYENRWIAKNRRHLIIEWSNTVILDPGGEVEHVIATGIDITQKRENEEIERQRIMELAHVSRLSTMGQMATEIAHELNQPLCAIASYSDTCLRMFDAGNAEAQDVRHVLTEIGHQSTRAAEVIRRIRNFVRKEEAERVTVDLNELVQDVVQLTQVEARWNQINVQMHLQEGGISVRVDKILIEQVIMNLVRNAFEAIALAKSPQRTVDIDTRSRKDGVCLVEVKDSGPGLTPENVGKIFQPFFTTKANGMGMGLSLSMSIAKAHGGTLSAEPQSGGGSIFRLELPATALEEKSDAARSYRLHR